MLATELLLLLKHPLQWLSTQFMIGHPNSKLAQVGKHLSVTNNSVFAAEKENLALGVIFIVSGSAGKAFQLDAIVVLSCGCLAFCVFCYLLRLALRKNISTLINNN